MILGLFGGNMTDVLIPARNEAETIGLLVRGFRGKGRWHSRIGKIIVVDNASTDDTASIARAAGACVVTCDVIGKGQAVSHGLQMVTSPRVLLCDGDLTPLRDYQVAVLASDRMGTAMVIGIPRFTENVPWAERGMLWGWLSGVRSVPVAMLADLKERSLLHGYTVEVMMNKYAQLHDMPVIKIPLWGVQGRVKWGLARREAMEDDIAWMAGKDFRRLITEKRVQ
jgi:glycosyltransferase involved in cell wall biosynthesis